MAVAKLVLVLAFFFIQSLTTSLTLPLQATATKSFVSPIQKDRSTLQYIITAYLQTPLRQAKLLVDLGASFTWVNCDDKYFHSTTYKHIPCDYPLADLLGQPACLVNCVDPPGPNCANNSCLLSPVNPIKPIDFTRSDPIATALLDYLALPELINGSSQVGPLEKIRNFIFSCGHTSYLKGLARGVVGLAGFGRSNISIPVQITPHFFAICLSGSKSQPGVAFFGSKGPYYFSPGIDLSSSLTYTPLIVNPVGKDSGPDNKIASPEYYIELTSVKVNNKVVQFNQSLLAITSENGFGGTTISTVAPYTKLESSIYKAVTRAFLKAAASSTYNLTKTTTKPVKPFGVCYPASDIKITKMGPVVPTIDLVLHNKDVVWKIFGSNSMVRIVKKGGVDVWCLAFVDGGARTTVRDSTWIGSPSVVIGGHQLEDNMLQFDLESKKLGFSSSILSKGTTCSNFKFSTKKI